MKSINYCKVIICLLVLLQAGSFAFAAKEKNVPAMPEWVSSPATVYPSDRYLQYVGYAAERNKAEVEAINGLAAIFGQSVKSDSLAQKRMAQAKSDGKVATVSVSAFSQDVLRSVDVSDLVGVEIKDYWSDGTTWYAIAVLDKTKTADIYTDMIRKNAKAINDLLQKAEIDTYSIEGYASYDFASDIALENEGHIRKLSVIKPEAIKSLNVNVPSSKEIATRRLEIAKKIPICVLISGDEDGKIASVFSEVISSSGFRGSLDSTTARYVLTGSLTFEESVSSDNKTRKCRYNLETYILDTENDHQVCPFNLSGRDSHVQYSEAKIRAMKSLEKKIKVDFKKTFAEYLKSL